MKLDELITYTIIEMFTYYTKYKHINITIDNDIIEYSKNIILSEYQKEQYINDDVSSICLNLFPFDKQYELNNKDSDPMKIFMDINDNINCYMNMCDELNIPIKPLLDIFTLNTNCPFDGFDINHHTIIKLFDIYFINNMHNN